MISSLKLESDVFLIINVYSPCEQAQKIVFLDNLLAVIKSKVSDEFYGKIICVGDFNIALGDLDIVSGHPHGADIRQAFNAFIQSLGFVDSWRMLHPSDKEFTWSRANPPSARRLDYIFTGEAIGCFITKSIIKSICFTDHRLMITSFEVSPFKYSKGHYKLNTSLLRDANYCNMIVKIINETFEEYNCVDAHLRWEMIKCNIKETSQQYSRFMARKRKDKSRNLNSTCRN